MAEAVEEALEKYWKKWLDSGDSGAEECTEGAFYAGAAWQQEQGDCETKLAAIRERARGLIIMGERPYWHDDPEGVCTWEYEKRLEAFVRELAGESE